MVNSLNKLIIKSPAIILFYFACHKCLSNCKMEFFGLTSYGVSDPIKDMMRPDYQEPTEPQKDAYPSDPKKSFSERIKELDCYIGFTDGYAYRSWDRLSRMRKKYIFKPVGPYEMYLYPGVNSMQYGWWNSDPNTCSESWYKPANRYPLIISDISSFISHCLKIGLQGLVILVPIVEMLVFGIRYRI